MRTLPAIKVEVPAQALMQLRHRPIVVQVHVLILHAPPQPLDELNIQLFESIPHFCERIATWINLPQPSSRSLRLSLKTTTSTARIWSSPRPITSNAAPAATPAADTAPIAIPKSPRSLRSTSDGIHVPNSSRTHIRSSQTESANAINSSNPDRQGIGAH